MRTSRVLAPLLPLAFLLMPGPAPATDDGQAQGRPAIPSRRLPWTDSRVVGTPEGPTPYKAARAFPKLSIRQPLALAPEPGTRRLFILQHLNYWAGPGRLLAVPDDQDAGEDDVETLLEIDGIAYGLAFHPDYERNGYLFLGQNAPAQGGPKATQVVRYTVDRSTGKVNPDSKVLIIEWPSDGHNGGDLAFANDRTLFVSSGDGTSGSDANDTGQSLDDLLGAVVRIDVDRPEGGKAYGIPADNPFVDRPGARPELWAYGLRNPWRLSYDPPSGQLWAGNNGQDVWEQVYLIEKGANYGWPVTEGSQIFQAGRDRGPDPIKPPTAEHHHSEARSLTGGRVYRGDRLPDLVGAYVYGDWSTGRVWGIKHDGQKVLWHRELVDTPSNITGFGTDHAGELYVIDQGSGFYRLEPTTEADRPAHPFPTRLSETGLFAAVDRRAPHPAALPIEVVAPQWADGASIERFGAFPGTLRVEQRPQPNAGGAWTLPEGTVLVQTLSLDLVDESGKPARTPVETRLLARQQGEWAGYSYRWNEDRTDAELVAAGGDVEEFEVADPDAPDGRRAQLWRFPSRAECLICHSRAAGFVLAFTPLQLDRPGRDSAEHQLDAFERIGLFEGKLPERTPDRARLVDPHDPTAPLEARVKAYLHVNCSTCHVNEGGGNSRMELGYGTPLGGMHLIGEKPVHSDFNLPDARLVAPGAPGRSVLLSRVSIREGGQMPPLGSTEVDRRAVAFITEWVKGLAPKP